MAGYRSAFIKTTHLLSSALPMDRLVKATGQRLVAPVYHLVSDNAPLHIRHLYKVKSARQFANDLDFLLKHYKPIDMEGLMDIVRNGKKAKENSFIVTFDDGLREFHDIAAPILLAKGIPAINFLNRDFVDNKGLFFRYKASLLIEHLEKHGIDLHHTEGNDFMTQAAHEGVVEWMRKNWHHEYKSYKHMLLHIKYAEQYQLDILAELTGLDFNAYLAHEKPYMDTGQIRRLADQGFVFGAHSNTHPEYRFIDLASQLKETRESIGYVANAFPSAYRTFAFPFTDFGVGKEFFTELNKEQAVDITFGSAGLKNDPVPNHIQRIPLEMADLDAGQVLKSEYLYYLLKQAFGKNTVKRI